MIDTNPQSIFSVRRHSRAHRHTSRPLRSLRSRSVCWDSPASERTTEITAESLSCVRLFVAPWPVARQAPLSTGFPRQEHWSELPFPPPRDLPNPGIKPTSPMSPALAGRFLTTVPPRKPMLLLRNKQITWEAIEGE